MTTRASVAACAVGAMLLTSCGDVHRDYSTSEQVLVWTLRSYVALDGSQERVLADQLTSYRQWHCSGQATAYAAWVRSAAADFIPSLTADHMARRVAGLEFLGRLAVEEAVPRVATVLQSLSERQARELTRNLDHAAARAGAEVAARGPADAMARGEQRLRRHLEEWLGPLSPLQRQLVSHWSAAMRPVGTDLYGSSALPVIALRSALRQRARRSVLETELRAMLLAPDRWWTRASDPRFAANRVETWKLLTKIAASTDPDQRQHLVQKAEAMAAELEHDACDAVH